MHPLGGIGVEAKKTNEKRAPVPRTLSKAKQSQPARKRLPWLDGKSSLVPSPQAPSSPLAQDGDTATVRTTKSASPHSRLPSLIPKDAAPLQRPVGSPSSRRPSRATANKRRVSSARRPSAVSKVPASTPLRASTPRPVPGPSRDAASRRPSAVAPESKRRLSIMPADKPKEFFQESRSRAESIAPLPGHLERDGTPSSEMSDATGASFPQILSSVNLAPVEPSPRPAVFERMGSRRLSSAVENLEDLVQEAAIAAKNTQDPRHVEDIHHIIEDAKHAIKEVGNDQRPELMKTVSPLEASESERGTSCSSYEKRPSLDTPVQANDTRDTARRVPNAIDWANPDPDKASSSSPSPSSRDNSRGRRRSSSRSDARLLPPEPTQAAPREHVEFVLRPTQEHSRGRPLRRNTSGSDSGPRRRRRHRSSFRRISHQPPASSSPDASFEAGYLTAAERPGGIEQYGTELQTNDQSQSHIFSLRRNHRRQPIARNWRTSKKRLTAAIACINTALLGILVGIYAGEVPSIQYMLADERHHVIIGNAVFYAGLAISTFIAWPLPLLHGRKPYILAALAMALPLHFPQALVVSARRSPKNAGFRTGLLTSRAFSGLALGFANVNFIGILFDLFGASLQSKHPHQEFIVPTDVRKHGGGMGMWLGIWSWCWIGSVAVGFQIGAAIIKSLTPDWGFYVCIIILASSLVLNVIAPETRRSAYRLSVTEVYDRDENYITRRVERGEVKLHISTEGPKYWFEEAWAGMKLSIMMLCQPGFLVVAVYLGWIYAQTILVVVLLGALLSRDYRWQPEFVGLGVLSIAIGALLAIPLTKASIFSRERKKGFRTDSMTFEKQVTWSSHLVRRVLFTTLLPLMGLAYTISSAGRPRPHMVPIVFAGAVGFFSILAIAECHGLIMETFDTCDLQPGVNTKHRLQSMAVQDRRRRTNYSSFPRVSAGIFAAQTLAFIGAAIATLVGGVMTRRIGAQASTGVTAGILLFLTVLLSLVLWRFKSVQVIPNHLTGTRRDTAAWVEFREMEGRGRGADWQAVVLGNPSSKMRRMSVLELGALSRWTEVRKLNFLISPRERKRDDWHHGASW